MKRLKNEKVSQTRINSDNKIKLILFKTKLLTFVEDIMPPFFTQLDLLSYFEYIAFFPIFPIQNSP